MMWDVTGTPSGQKPAFLTRTCHPQELPAEDIGSVVPYPVPHIVEKLTEIEVVWNFGARNIQLRAGVVDRVQFGEEL